MHKPDIVITDDMRREASKYEDSESFLRSGGFSVETLDRAAFGHEQDSVVDMDPDDLTIHWQDDWDNVVWEVERSGKSAKEWSKGVSLEEPVEVSFRDGVYRLEDGHHRVFAARTLGKKVKARLEFWDTPVKYLSPGDPDIGYDDFIRKAFAAIKGEPTNELKVQKGFAADDGEGDVESAYIVVSKERVFVLNFKDDDFADKVARLIMELAEDETNLAYDLEMAVTDAEMQLDPDSKYNMGFDQACSFVESLPDYVPGVHVFMFRKVDGEYYLDPQYGEYTNSVNSHELRKLAKLVPNVAGFIGPDGPERMDRAGRLPEVVYHGTNVENALGILKTGIRPNPGIANWDVKHSKHVFMTASPRTASSYAKSATYRKTDSKRYVVLAIDASKLDRAKLTMDYDYYLNFVDKEKYSYEEFDRIYSDATDVDSPGIKGKKPTLTEETRGNKFGYTGTVMPSWVKSVTVENFYGPDKTMSPAEFVKEFAQAKESLNDDLEDLPPQYVTSVAPWQLGGQEDTDDRDTVSFDFDGVMHTSVEGLDPMYWDEWEDMEPNARGIDMLKKEAAAGNRIVITTARPAWTKDALWSFLEHHGITEVEEIIATNDWPKGPVLAELGIIRHYDDNKSLKQSLDRWGIEFVYIDPAIGIAESAFKSKWINVDELIKQLEEIKKSSEDYQRFLINVEYYGYATLMSINPNILINTEKVSGKKPISSGPIRVIHDVPKNKMYIVDGHNRVREAKDKGYNSIICSVVRGKYSKQQFDPETSILAAKYNIDLQKIYNDSLDAVVESVAVELGTQEDAWLDLLIRYGTRGLDIKGWTGDKRMGDRTFIDVMEDLVDAGYATAGVSAYTVTDAGRHYIDDKYRADTPADAWLMDQGLGGTDRYKFTMYTSTYERNNPDYDRTTVAINEIGVEWFNSYGSRGLGKLSKLDKEHVRLYNQARLTMSLGHKPGDTVRLYRGLRFNSLDGKYDPERDSLRQAWTLSKKEAQRFASFNFGYTRDVAKHGVILTADVPVKDVILVITEHGEDEVIIKRQKNVRVEDRAVVESASDEDRFTVDVLEGDGDTEYVWRVLARTADGTEVGEALAYEWYGDVRDDFGLEDMPDEEYDVLFEEPMLELNWLVVEPGWRGRGVARAIVARFMAEAGPRAVYCNACPFGDNPKTQENLESLVELYSSFGFQVIKREPNNVQMVRPAEAIVKESLEVGDRSQFGYEIVEELPMSDLYDRFKDHRRLGTFAAKGTKCVAPGCDRVGTKLMVGVDKHGGRHVDLYCDDGMPMTVDHIKPKAKGGPNHISNYQPMCRKCNIDKKDTYEGIRHDRVKINLTDRKHAYHWINEGNLFDQMYDTDNATPYVLKRGTMPPLPPRKYDLGSEDNIDSLARVCMTVDPDYLQAGFTGESNICMVFDLQKMIESGLAYEDMTDNGEAEVRFKHVKDFQKYLVRVLTTNKVWNVGDGWEDFKYRPVKQWFPADMADVVQVLPSVRSIGATLKRLYETLSERTVSDRPVTVDDFFVATTGTFTEVDRIPAGLKMIYASRESQYYVNEDETVLYRISNHWGSGIKLCDWYLDGYERMSVRDWKSKYTARYRRGMIRFDQLRHKEAELAESNAAVSLFDMLVAWWGATGYLYYDALPKGNRPPTDTGVRMLGTIHESIVNDTFNDYMNRKLSADDIYDDPVWCDENVWKHLTKGWVDETFRSNMTAVGEPTVVSKSYDEEKSNFDRGWYSFSLGRTHKGNFGDRYVEFELPTGFKLVDTAGLADDDEVLIWGPDLKAARVIHNESQDFIAVVADPNDSSIRESVDTTHGRYEWDLRPGKKIAYHGTNAKFDRFDMSWQGQTDEGFYGRGFYFSPDENEAADYGSNVLECELDLGRSFGLMDWSTVGHYAEVYLREALASLDGMPESLKPNKTLPKGYHVEKREDTYRGESVVKIAVWPDKEMYSTDGEIYGEDIILQPQDAEDPGWEMLAIVEFNDALAGVSWNQGQPMWLLQKLDRWNFHELLSRNGYDSITVLNPGMTPVEYVVWDADRIKVLGGEAVATESKGLSESSSGFYHGTPDFRNLKPGKMGVHVGTHLAATQALEARIGVRADGKPWDGTSKYGDTLLAGKNRLKEIERERGYYVTTGFNSSPPENDYYPGDRVEKAKYSNGDVIPMDALPAVFKVKIVGKMTNTPIWKVLSDTKANAVILGNIRRGSARSGYYYTNDGEDSGSISAVVPDFSFLSLEQVTNENREHDQFFASQALEKARKMGATIQGDIIYLYHGTSPANHKKIYKSSMLKSGTWLSPDPDVCRRFALMHIKRGEPVVSMYGIYAGSLLISGDYFTTREPLYLNNGVYRPEKRVKTTNESESPNLYHVSPVENRESITKNGLDYRLDSSPWYSPEDPIEYPKGNYFWYSIRDAERYAGGLSEPMDIWATADTVQLEADPVTAGGGYTTKPIKSVSLVKTMNETRSDDGYLYHGTHVGAAIGMQRDGKMFPRTHGQVSFSRDIRVAEYYAGAKGGSRGVVLRTRDDGRFVPAEHIDSSDGYEMVRKGPVYINTLEARTPVGWVPLAKYDFVDGSVTELRQVDF